MITMNQQLGCRSSNSEMFVPWLDWVALSRIGWDIEIVCVNDFAFDDADFVHVAIGIVVRV